MSRYGVTQKQRRNYIMTKERELHIRSLPFLTLLKISEYMDCSLFVAGIYVEELKLKLNESSCNLVTIPYNNSEKAKKNKTGTDKPI